MSSLTENTLLVGEIDKKDHWCNLLFNFLNNVDW